MERGWKVAAPPHPTHIPRNACTKTCLFFTKGHKSDSNHSNNGLDSRGQGTHLPALITDRPGSRTTDAAIRVVQAVGYITTNLRFRCLRRPARSNGSWRFKFSVALVVIPRALSRCFFLTVHISYKKQ